MNDFTGISYNNLIFRQAADLHNNISSGSFSCLNEQISHCMYNYVYVINADAKSMYIIFRIIVYNHTVNANRNKEALSERGGGRRITTRREKEEEVYEEDKRIPNKKTK